MVYHGTRHPNDRRNIWDIHPTDLKKETTMRGFWSMTALLAVIPALYVHGWSVDRRSLLRDGWISSMAYCWWYPCSAEAAAPSTALWDRFEQDVLHQLTPSASTAGVDNTYFPDFMEGTWQVTQTLVNVSTPLGLRYIGGPNGLVTIAEKSLADSRQHLHQPVELKLRFVRTKWGVVEDRLFNAADRLNAFAGRTVVASTDYANVRASNRASVLAHGGTTQDPLQTVVVRFKGPAAQKTFVTWHITEPCSGSASCCMISEGQRSIFALTNENTAPPIFTDSEVLYRLEQVNGNHIKGRLRIAGYLNAQSDKLYFDAKNRAVSIQDYTLDFRRIL